MTVIKDGKGRGFVAAVNSDKELTTRSTIVEQRLASALDQNYYEASTGQIILTNANETGIIYIKNLNSLDIVIDRVFYDIWSSTGGDANGGILKYYKNPTITGGTILTPINTNFGSVLSANVTSLISLTTITGIVWWTALITPLMSIPSDEGRIVVPTNSSFGISIQAPTGNTSMKVSINIAFFMFDKELL